MLGRGGDRAIAELELAAQAEHGHDAVCEIVDGDDLEERSPRSSGSRRSTSSCSATPRRSRRGSATPARCSSATSSPVASGDYATGGNHVLPTGGWARSVGGLGLETFLKPVTVQRLTRGGPRARAADGRGARRGRGHARARSGGRAVRALAPELPRRTSGRRRRRSSRARAGLDPVEIVRFDGNVPPLPLPSSRPGAIAAALADGEHVPARRLSRASTRRSPRYAGVEPENVVLGAGADDLILLRRARVRRARRRRRGPAGADVSALPRRGASSRARRSATTTPVLTFCCRPGNPLGDARRRCRTRGRSSSTRRTSSTRARRRVPLLDDGVIVIRTFSKAFALAGARIGYLLARRDTAAELRRAPGARSRLDALGRARARGAAHAARRRAGDRGARAARGRAARARLRAAAVARELRLRPGRRAAARSPSSLLARGCVVRVTGGGIRITVRDREDDDLLLAALAGERRAAAGARVRHVRATAETSMRVRLGLDGAGRVRVATGAGLYDHFLEQLAFHGGLDLVVDGSGDCETGDASHRRGHGDRVRRGARPRARRPARDRALRRRGRADGRRARARGRRPRRAARRRDRRSQHDPGLARHALESLAAGGADDAARRARPGAIRTTSPRRRTRRSAARCARRSGATAPSSRRRRACCERSRSARYGAGNVRSVELALARLGAERIAESDVVRDADLAVLPGRRLGALRDGRAARARPRRRAPRARTPRAGRSSASASACSSRSTRARRTAASPGSASCPAARCGCATAACRASAGRRSSRAARRTGSRTRTRPRRRRDGDERRPRRDRRARLVHRRAVPSREERRRGRALPGAMPLPRLIPCLDVAGGRVVKGVRFRGAARRRRPRRARRGVLGRRRRRARLPRHLGDGRRRAAAAVDVAGARRRAGDDPVHVRRRHPHASTTRPRCSRRERTR